MYYKVVDSNLCSNRAPKFNDSLKVQYVVDSFVRGISWLEARGVYLFVYTERSWVQHELFARPRSRVFECEVDGLVEGDYRIVPLNQLSWINEDNLERKFAIPDVYSGRAMVKSVMLTKEVTKDFQYVL